MQGNQGNDPTGGWSPAPPPPPGGQSWQQPQGQSWAQPSPAGPQLRPLNLGDVLDGSFRILTRNWRTFAIALGIIVVPVSLLSAIAQNLSTGGVGFMDLLSNPAALETAGAAQTNPFLSLLQVAVSLVSVFFIQPYLIGVCCLVAADSWLRGLRPEPGDVLRRAARRYWALVGTVVLIYLLVIAVFVPVIAVGVGAAVAGGENVGLILLTVFLALALGLVAVALGLMYSLAFPAVVVEDAGPVQSLRRSWRLMRQRFWPRVGTLLLLLLIVGMVSGVLSVIGIIGVAFGGVVAVVLLTIGSVLNSLVTTPVLASGVTLLYLDGRIRSEGLDLQAQAEQLGGPPPGAPPGR